MEEKGETCTRSQQEGLNREAVGTLRWLQTGCLSSAIPRHIMTKRQQAVCWSEVSQGSDRPVLEAARRDPQTSAAVRTSGTRFSTRCLKTRWAVVAQEPIPGVRRFIPAKPGIQPGVRLALRLAGMTTVLPTLSLTRQLDSRTRCRIADETDEKLRFPLCCLLVESADALSGFLYAGVFPHLDDPSPGEVADTALHARLDQ